MSTESTTPTFGLIVIGAVLAVDGLIFYRLSVWWQEPLDRGSLVSLFAYDEQLSPQLLAGISLAVTAAAIIAHREASGPFESIDQLLEVKGIGPAKFEAVKDLVTL